jgi:hypothetical protein
MPGPLHGIRIIEVANVVLGPWAARFSPTWVRTSSKSSLRKATESGRSDPTAPTRTCPLYSSRAIVIRAHLLLIQNEIRASGLPETGQNTDTLLHNNRPQVMTKLSLDYADFKAVNPRIIYCGAYGYSKEGPYGERGPSMKLFKSPAALPT